MEIVDYGCELNNYCIFQGVISDLFRCDSYGSPCSSDAYNSRLDGTFICNYHLGKYFKILKSSFKIPSGKDNKSFKMLVGQSLIQQNNPNRILIPLDHEQHLNSSARSAMEKFVIYTIYEDQAKNDELCKMLIQQEYFEQPLWTRFQFAINTIMGMVKPSVLCERPFPTTETRIFNAQSSYEQYPPF